VLSDYRKYLDGIFMYNACDTLRNFPEILQNGLKRKEVNIPILKIHIPMVKQDTEYVKNYFWTEITNLIREIEDYFGVKFQEDKFQESIQLYNKMRKLCIEYDNLSGEGKVSFSEVAETIQDNYFLPVEKQISNLERSINHAKLDEFIGNKSEEKRIILSGIVPPPKNIIKFMENSGLLIVGNDISSLSRFYSYVPKISKNPGKFYWDFYRNHIPCTTLHYSADERIEYLINYIKRTNAIGHIFIAEKFCEYELFEYPYLEKKLNDAGISSLSLEFSLDDYNNVETYKTRIEAFSELLEKKVEV
jgi:benzoyl-CoA reductase/2-hydroxyglutaryl-CoA dehydratase subunit BcrC/BadD/HgdB